MSFYADDVLLFITDPLISLPNLLNTLDTFHHLTGRVNQWKCIALPINLPQPLLNTLKTKCEFTWSSGTLPYLGIRLAPFLKLIYMHNYPQSFSNIKQLLTQWSSYHISFLGRIQAIKMSFLSKLLFYFRSLPIYVPHSTIMAVQSELLKFVWQNKKPCMSRLLMHRAQSRGVLGCPDLWKYYLALRLIQLAQWHTPLSSVQWLQFKSISVVPFYLPGLLWSSFVSPKDVAQLNGIVGQSLYLWFLYKVKFKLLSNPPCLASFLGDIQFPPAFNTDQEFASWTSQGLVTLDFLLQGSSFCTFELLQHNYALHRSEFYKYLQILHFFTSMVTQKANSVKSPCENLCGEASRDRGILYKYLNDHDTTAKSIAMLGWEARVDQEIPVEDWYDMVSNMHKWTRSIAIKETIVQLHTRWYYTPYRLHRIYPLFPNTCFRGCRDRGTLLHMVWNCTVLKPLWQRTSSLLLQITGVPVTLTYQMCASFLPSSLMSSPPPLKSWHIHIFSAIQWAIALNWRCPSVPCSQVLLHMKSIRLMERVHHTLMD